MQNPRKTRAKMGERGRRTLWLTLPGVLGLLGFIALACGPTAEPTGSLEFSLSPEEPGVPATRAPDALSQAGTLTLWHAWKEEQVESLYQVIGAFQEVHPEVWFEVQYVPLGDLRDHFEAAAATGGGPTVLIGASDWGPAFYDAELVVDLSTLISDTSLSAINPAALGAVEYKDALIGLPQTIEGVVMYRNTSIIPDAPPTWADLVAAAQATTEGDVIGANLERGFFFSAAHLTGIGGQLMDRDGNPLFNDEKGVEWLELLKSFDDAGPTGFYTDDDLDLFKAGQVGMIIDDTRNRTPLLEAIGAENLAIDPWPTLLSGYVQTENIYLSASVEGEEKDAAWAFMEFFLSPEAQALLAGGGHIPAVMGASVIDPPMAQAMKALATGVTFPVIPEMACYWEPLEAALQLTFDEGTDPAAALSQAQNSVELCIVEMGGGVLPAEQVVGTVTLWHAWDEAETLALNEVIAAFQERYPDARLEVLHVPEEDLRGRFEAAAGGGRGPSLLIGAADWGPAFYEAELVADVTGLTTVPFLASINEAALGAVKYQGALVGLPQAVEGVVMYRNTSIIPDAPSTWVDLVAAAQAATEGDVIGANLERGFFFSAAHLTGIGGQLMDRDGNPLFNDEKGVEWLELLKSFDDAGPTGFYTDDDLDLFKAGQVGMIIDDTANRTPLLEAIGAENLAIDPWPTPLSGYVQTENIYLGTSVEGEEKDAAWAFMEFFLSPEAQTILAGAGHLPSVAGVELGDPLMLQAVVALQDGTAFPATPQMGVYGEALDAALVSVLEEGADPAGALQRAEDSIVAAKELGGDQ